MFQDYRLSGVGFHPKLGGISPIVLLVGAPTQCKTRFGLRFNLSVTNWRKIRWERFHEEYDRNQQARRFRDVPRKEMWRYFDRSFFGLLPAMENVSSEAHGKSPHRCLV